MSLGGRGWQQPAAVSVVAKSRRECVTTSPRSTALCPNAGTLSDDPEADDRGPDLMFGETERDALCES